MNVCHIRGTTLLQQLQFHILIQGFPESTTKFMIFAINPPNQAFTGLSKIQLTIRLFGRCQEICHTDSSSTHKYAADTYL